MSDYSKLLECLKIYQSDFRRETLHSLKIGSLYDLFPLKGDPILPCKLKWNDTWANSGCAGVYVFLNEHGQVLYIGKASMNSTLGARLSAYCAYDEGRTCKLKHNGWTETPRYVLTIGVPSECPWEAPALEEYLIRQLNPIDNINGKFHDS